METDPNVETREWLRHLQQEVKDQVGAEGVIVYHDPGPCLVFEDEYPSGVKYRVMVIRDERQFTNEHFNTRHVVAILYAEYIDGSWEKATTLLMADGDLIWYEEVAAMMVTILQSLQYKKD